MAKLIKTKIVATVGPASQDVGVLMRLIAAGVDCFRINFSHGTADQHQLMLDNIRAAARRQRATVAVMGDLCGPKIRVGAVQGGGVLLAEGTEITIQRKPVEGTAARISTTLAELIDDVRAGQRILLDDGKLELKVVRREPPKRVVCRVITGGVLAGGKGLNLPQTNLRLPALTEKDKRDAAWIASRDFDYVALSFVRRASDVTGLRKILTRSGSAAKIVAKIEKPQAMRNIDSILKVADAVLVARGDLGVEMPLPQVPLAQKRLVDLAGRAGKCCIVATQMLETMTESPSPTRAEVSDVANAVFDGADAVMLSGETAVGKHPVRAVKMMNEIARRVEDHLRDTDGDAHYGRRLSDDQRAGVVSGPLAAIARAVRALACGGEVRAVVAYSLTGSTAQALSKMRLPVPILMLTPTERAAQQACLYYGVQSARADLVEHTREVLAVAARHIRKLRWARKGQKVLVVSGRPLGKSGNTNTLVVHAV